MNGYLFDTCAISHWFRKNKGVERRLEQLDPNEFLYVSSVSIGEIEFGHLSASVSDKSRQEEFRKWINEVFNDHVLSITTGTARSYAFLRRMLCDKFIKKSKHIQLYEDAQSQVLGIDENDLWLVAQAHERNLIFITTDKMTRIREVVENHVQVETWPIY